MTNKFNDAVGILASYFTSAFTVFQNVDGLLNWVIAAVPAFVGAYLTWQIAQIRKEEARGLRIKNDKLEKADDSLLDDELIVELKSKENGIDEAD